MISFEKLNKINSKKQEELGESKEVDLLFETYPDSELFEKLNIQKKKGENPTALFTDIDNTFYKADKKDALATLTREAREKNIPIIAVTGNDFKGMKEKINKEELPYFDVVVGSVGTEIWVLHKKVDSQITYKKDDYFEKLLIESGFEREKLVRTSIDFIDDLKNSLPESEIDFQNPELEREWLSNKNLNCQPFKISLYFFANQQLLKEISKKAEKKFSNQSVIICEEINYNSSLPPNEETKKYCLDMLPVTKKDAVDYLSKLAGIKQGIVAGDSGNDVDMLLNSGNLNAVLVGGYKNEAIREINKSIFEKKPGRSFQKVMQSDGSIKAIYIEKDPKRQASDSILRAAKILTRAENIKKIREIAQKNIFNN